MEQKNKSLGLAAIFLGVIFLLENLQIFQFNFQNIWPVIVALVGLGFAFGWFANRDNHSLIMPAVVLIVYGLLFSYCQLTTWDNMLKLWPVLLIGPGLGFLMLYFLADRENTALWSASVLIILGMLFMFRFIEYLRYWPALLILGGIILVLYPGKAGKISK